ncbi:hypothetical protein bcgnr5385_16210 [Bacillus cereus]
MCCSFPYNDCLAIIIKTFVSIRIIATLYRLVYAVGVLRLINGYGRIESLMLIVSFCFKTREENENKP